VTNLRAAIYVRVSVVKQTKSKVEFDSSGSIDSQLTVCRALAKGHGATEVREYVDEGISGFSGGRRPAFSALLAALDAGELDLIVARHMDRLGRNEEEADLFRYALTRARVPLLTQGGSLLEPWTASGGLLAKMTAAVAEYESVLKSERLLNHYSRLRSAGYLVARGRRIFGYDESGLKLETDEAALIREAYKTVLNGGTIYSIVQEWNENAVPTVGGSAQWSHAAVMAVLKRPKNAGLVRKPDIIERDVNNKRRKIPQRGYIPDLEGNWAKIISKEDYDAVISILDDPKRKSGPGPKTRNLLTGIIRCGVCGGPLRGSTSKSKLTGASILSYRCKENLVGDTRRHTSITSEIADKAVRNAIAAAFLFGAKELLPKSEDATTQNLIVELAQVREQFQSAFKLVAQLNDINTDSITYIQQLQTQERELERKIAEQQRESASRILLVDLREGLFTPGKVSITQVADVKKQLLERLQALPIENQRALVRDFLEVSVRDATRRTNRVKITHKIVKTLNEPEDE
jgi:DNA invertase Pin-like site-specific DNA recombinase